MNTPRRDNLLHSAVNGLEIWLWYAVVEYFFNSAIPVLIHREKILDEARWRGTVILFICYAILGILVGLMAGISMGAARSLARAEFDHRNRKLIILLLVAVFAINLATLPDQPGKVAALLALASVAAAIFFDVGKTDSDPGLSGSPWAVAAILILVSRLALVNWKNSSALLAVPLTLVAALVSLGAVVVAIRLLFWARSSKLWSPVLERGLMAAVVIGIVFGPGAVSSIYAGRGAPAAHSNSGKPLPNIILITMDTVRADHLGIYGYARQNTPNLKELLKVSTLYTDFISASTLTLPSHASMFTGLYPQSHAAYKQFPNYPMGRPLPQGIPTMASILDSAGYYSMALSANFWYLVPDWGLLNGFEYSWTPIPVRLIEANHGYMLRYRLSQLLHVPPFESDFYSSPNVDADTITRRAEAQLDRFSDRQAPFFLFLNYMDAHWPYHSPAPFDSAYPGRSNEFDAADEEGALRTRVDCGGEPVPAGYQANAESQYDGAIAFIDFKIGELIRHLKEKGLFDDSLIIVTSDHGETFGDRGVLGHNVSVYQDQVHVPLIIKYPRSKEPNRVDKLASHVDLLPTILEVAGLAPRTDLPGVSLLHLDSKPDRLILSERHFGACQTPNARVPEVQYALFQGSSKMISSSSGDRELYDLAKDPKEQANLYQEHPPLALETALHDWLRNTPRNRATQQPLDEIQMKRLRSLGYLQ